MLHCGMGDEKNIKNQKWKLKAAVTQFGPKDVTSFHREAEQKLLLF
jgi:hypothetical protein